MEAVVGAPALIELTWRRLNTSIVIIGLSTIVVVRATSPSSDTKQKRLPERKAFGWPSE